MTRRSPSPRSGEPRRPRPPPPPDAAAVPPGSGGLLALDWFGGNRVPHGDPGLSGLLAGLTLAATPAAIYRALTEALAYGTRAILDTAAEARGAGRAGRS